MCSIRCDTYPTDKWRSTTHSTICTHTGHAVAAIKPCGLHESARIAASDDNPQLDSTDNPVNARSAERRPGAPFDAPKSGTMLSGKVTMAMIVKMIETFIRKSRV